MSYLPLPRDAKPPDSESVAGILQVANLGDSGCMVLRDGRIVLRTVEQTHAFNFPRQLGTVRAAAAALSPLGAAGQLTPRCARVPGRRGRRTRRPMRTG